MSSRRCSGSEFLLRMTVAMPVSVATLPIGSLVVEGADESAGAGAAGVAGVGAGGVGLAAGGAGVAGVG